MSNPAVIMLDKANLTKTKFKRFQIEDNIGESIHLHLDNTRIDFSIKEFLQFSKMIRESLEEINFLNNYKIKNFDEYFLKLCADLLPNLKDIKIEEIKLSKLKCIVHPKQNNKSNSKKIVPITDTPAYKYLTGYKKDFIEYNQYNYFNTNNKQRFEETLNSIKNKGYPFKDNYIILFDGQSYIRDGQHRAAILAYLYGADAKIKVMRFYFDGKSHLFCPKKTKLKNKLKNLIVFYLRKLRLFEVSKKIYLKIKA